MVQQLKGSESNHYKECLSYCVLHILPSKQFKNKLDPFLAKLLTVCTKKD